LNPRQIALDALLLAEPAAKCAAVDAMPLPVGEQAPADPDSRRLLSETLPGRGTRPVLVAPAQLAQRPVSKRACRHARGTRRPVSFAGAHRAERGQSGA